MHKLASEILAEFTPRDILQSRSGPDTRVTGITNAEDGGPGDLVFVGARKYVDVALARRPAAIVTLPDLAGAFASLDATAILISANVDLAQAILLQRYADRDVYDTGWPRVHDSAVIHASAQVAASAVVGPGAVLSRDVVIGEHCVVMANAVVEQGCRIGAHTVIHPNVVIGHDCEIGERALIKSGTVIGMEGFGFAQDARGKSHRLPQIGKVVMGDDVVVGANCTIDRAAYRVTRIASGTKLDALVHIAHNVQVGEDCLICAQTAIAGTTRLGDRVTCGGQTGVINHRKVCSDVVLTQRAGVIADIEEPGWYGGHPAQPIRKFFATVSLTQRLAEMKKSINAIEKQLAELAGE